MSWRGPTHDGGSYRCQHHGSATRREVVARILVPSSATQTLFSWTYARHRCATSFSRESTSFSLSCKELPRLLSARAIVELRRTYLDSGQIWADVANVGKNNCPDWRRWAGFGSNIGSRRNLWATDGRSSPGLTGLIFQGSRRSIARHLFDASTLKQSGQLGPHGLGAVQEDPRLPKGVGRETLLHTPASPKGGGVGPQGPRRPGYARCFPARQRRLPRGL